MVLLLMLSVRLKNNRSSIFMKSMDVLSDVLAAKDARYKLRKNIASEGYFAVSLNFNIPGLPKSNNDIRKAFIIAKNNLIDFLTANRIKFIKNDIIIKYDMAGDICFIPVEAEKQTKVELKTILENFESNHALGRILDVDLFDLKALPVSSAKKKVCFICKNKPAIQCMHEGIHPTETLQKYVNSEIKIFLSAVKKDEVCRQIVSFAIQSILMEVSLHGKPGLVCPDTQGSHTDMNYLTFIYSTSAICTYFDAIARLGYNWDGISNQNIISRLRLIGIKMEHEMLKASNGINTQKGIIFLMGFSLFAAAYTLKNSRHFDVVIFRNTLKLLNKDIVSKELENGLNKGESNGEKCFYKYGKTHAGGIRAGIEAGLPLVFDQALPLMKTLFANGFDFTNKHTFEEKLLRVLFKIMSENNDTNILYRAGLDELKIVKKLSLKINTTKEQLSINRSYNELLEYCYQNNISPGGSADLLATTIFIFQTQNKYK